MPQTVAQLVVHSLSENGIDQLYCLPGVQNDDFFDALYDHQDKVTPIQTRHEQGATYMALAAAMATGKQQACCIVPGPGFLNGTAGIATAYSANAPVMTMVGQIPSGAVGKGFGQLHEIPDQEGILERLTKHSEVINSADGAAAKLRAAWSALLSGRPRPVGLEIPVNVWKQDVSDGDAVAGEASNPSPDQNALDRAVDLIANAKSPMIAVGAGAQGVSEQVTELADRLGAPVTSFRNGNGVVSSDHALSINMPTGHRLWPDVDLIIGIGTRMQTQRTAWGMDENLKVIHIDIDEEELTRISAPDAAIQADTADVMPMLLEALGPQPNRSDWTEKVATTKEAVQAKLVTGLAPQASWLEAIRDGLPRDGIFVDELTQMGYVSRILFPSYNPRTFLSCGYQGTLGWGIAATTGAAHARRDVPVVGIAGDGGALFTITELATAVHHNIPATYIVFNDNAFGNVRRFQIEEYNNRPIASDLSSPDFVALAKSFGVTAERTETPEALVAALKRATSNDGPNLIEVPAPAELPSPWAHIMLPKNRGT